MKRLTFLCFIFLCAACSNSPLEKGKLALKEGNYTEAMSYLEEAKIDEPNNKDVQQLIFMASEKANEELIKSNLVQYMTQMKPLVSELKSLFNSYDINNLNEQDIAVNMEQFQTIMGKIKEIQLPGRFEIMGDPNQILGFALENYGKMLNSSYPVIKQRQLINKIGDKRPPEISIDTYLASTDRMPMVNLTVSRDQFKEYMEDWESIVSNLEQY